MDRSLAAHLARPLRAQRRGSSRAAGGGRPRAARAIARARPAARGLAWAFTLLGAALRRRTLRLALIAALIGTAFVCGGWMLLRHTSLSAVRHVHVSGVRGPQARAIDAALTAAGRRMSTMAVDDRVLRAAVAPFRIVREVRARPGFPHDLHITVLEQPPVAVLVFGGARTAVAADGVVLGPALLEPALPLLGGYNAPAPGARLRSPSLLAPLAVLGAAPGALRHQVQRAYDGSHGLTLALHGGLLAYFGDATRPHAKWLALARVLADPSSQGASYVDVRVPEHAAAGFPAGVTPPAAASAASGGASPEQAGTSEATVAALAAALGPAGGESGAGPSTGGASGTAGEAGGSGEAGSSGEASGSGEAGASGETGSSGEASAHG